jgi:hypothetical protein
LLSSETNAEISAAQIKGSLEDILRTTRGELLKQGEKTEDGVRRTWHSVRDLVMRVVDWLDDKEKLDKAWTQAASDAEKHHDRKRN